MTGYKSHWMKWKGCKLCNLCKKRTRVVLARGQIPCSVLFIGEAPGPSEDVIGQPFIGPAGRLLDKIIATVLSEDTRWAMTNLVCCIPKDEDNAKFGEPPEYAIKACQPRLKEFIGLCEPKLIVTVGKLSDKWVSDATGLCKAPLCSIIHPAAILRADITQQGLLYQRAIVTLDEALSEISPS